VTRAREPRAAAIGLALTIAALAGAIGVSACAPGASALGPREPLQQVPGGDPERGRQVVAAYGCGSCHAIPGVPGANGRSAPALNDWSTRTTIVGLVPNTPERLVQWIMSPELLRSGTTMPNVGVSRDDALQMAAYLYTLR
jgi:cytochrome c